MKKTNAKLIQPQTKSLFKFNDSAAKAKKFTGNGFGPTVTTVGDPTVDTTTVLTW